MRLAWMVVLALATVARAATVIVVNQDGGGEGFNDPTPVAAVGGNPGTTLGAQRLNAFEQAANIWGAQLTSAVTIDVEATMDPLTCNASSATLGQASPTSVVRDFPGALFTNTWYPLALANKLASSDLAPSSSDITAQFNSAIGTTCALPLDWYYGLDGNAPGGTLDFVSVVLHELGHGLGFATFVDDSTGAELLNRADAFERNLSDDGVAWTSMSNGQRQASAIHTGHLVWTGSSVSANAGILSSGRDLSGNVLMFAPDPVQPGSSVSHWDTSCSPDQLMEPVYTAPNHEPGLALFALEDIGWSIVSATTTTTSVGGTTTSTTLPPECPSSPDTGCHAPSKATLTLTDRLLDTGDTLKWVWKGAGTSLAEFADPTVASATLRLCVYDASGALQPLMSSEIQSGGTCSSHPCWRRLGKAANPTGFSYRNSAGTPQGVIAAKLKARANGVAQVVVKGKGGNLPLPGALGLTTPVTVELMISNGGSLSCWQATYSNARKNDVARFKAATP